MATPVPLYQEVEAEIKQITASTRLRLTAVRRLALLVTGIIAAQSAVLNQVAAELAALGLTQTTAAESIARRLRRTLNDTRLTPPTCYAPALRTVLDWAAVQQGGHGIVLALDESSKADAVHLFRVSLPYRGGSLPLAWAVWPQNQPLATGEYWAHIEAVLAQVATVLPTGVEVVVVADRAYDIPNCVDRLAAQGWHWIVRSKANGAGRFRDCRGQESALRDLVRHGLPTPGCRWKARGAVFKQAGWRTASVVGLWGHGDAAPLVVLSDLPPQWALLRLYQRRFWIEPGFRNDKSRGWHWEESQVQGIAHHERVLLALAWASLVTLCLGAQAAHQRTARRAGPCRRPQHARASLFTLGLYCARQWLYRPLTVTVGWRLPALDAESWTRHWQRMQGYFASFATVRP